MVDASSNTASTRFICYRYPAGYRALWVYIFRFTHRSVLCIVKPPMRRPNAADSPKLTDNVNPITAPPPLLLVLLLLMMMIMDDVINRNGHSRRVDYSVHSGGLCCGFSRESHNSRSGQAPRSVVRSVVRSVIRLVRMNQARRRRRQRRRDVT